MQSLTPNIVLLNRGRLVAEGQVRQIRDLIDKYPHHIKLLCDEYRRLADADGGLGRRGRCSRTCRRRKALLVETRSPDVFYGRLPALSLEDGLMIKSVYSEDDNLEAVFKYLVNP